jgi:hypothetical protein
VENKITDLATGQKKKSIYQIVFIGAGGGSVHIRKKQIFLRDGFGGFL